MLELAERLLSPRLELAPRDVETEDACLGLASSDDLPDRLGRGRILSHLMREAISLMREAISASRSHPLAPRAHARART
jgi:hypothetical protein